MFHFWLRCFILAADVSYGADFSLLLAKCFYAHFFLSYKQLKSQNEIITENSLQTKYSNMMRSREFNTTLSQFNTAQLQDVIENGEFEKMSTQVTTQLTYMDEQQPHLFISI